MKNTTVTQAIEFLVELKKEVNPAVGEELDAIVEVLRTRLKGEKDEQKKSTQATRLPSAYEMEYHSPIFEPNYVRPQRPDGRRHEEGGKKR